MITGNDDRNKRAPQERVNGFIQGDRPDWSISPCELEDAQGRLLKERDAGNADIRGLFRHRPIETIHKEICVRHYPRAEISKVIESQALGRGAAISDSKLLFSNMDKLKDNRCCAIVTGQQVGVYGGPVYSLYKALSAVRLARAVSNQGIPAVPVFWLASYDHDFLEVSRIFFLNGKETPINLDLPPTRNRTPVGGLRIGSHANELLQLFADELHAIQAPFAESTLLLLSKIYVPDETFAGAFSKLLGSLTDRYGLLIIDPGVREVAVHLRELVSKELWGSSTSCAALAGTALELTRLGFQPRINSSPNEINLFFLNDRGERVRLRRAPDNKFAADGMPDGLSEARLRALLLDSPERFSPAALLRPVFESTVLPTLSYIAGPTESEYYAQLGDVYDWANLPYPQVASRASLSLIKQSEYSAFAQVTGHAVNTVLRSGHPLRSLAWSSLPTQVRLAYHSLDQAISILYRDGANLGSIASFLRDGLKQVKTAVLADGFERCRRGLDYSLPRIELWLAKIESEPHKAAEFSKEFRRIGHELSLLIDQVLKVGRGLNPLGISTVHRLLPANGPQERKLSLGQLLAEFGPNIADTLLPFAEPGQSKRQLLVLSDLSKHTPQLSREASFTNEALEKSRADLLALHRESDLHASALRAVALSASALGGPSILGASTPPCRVGVLALSGFGGSGNVARTCASGYVAAGNQCTLFTNTASSWSGSAWNNKQLQGVQLVLISVPLVPTEPQKQWIDVLAEELVANIEQNPLDVLHVHYVAGLLEAAVKAVDALSKKDIPLKLIATLHGTDVTQFGASPVTGPNIREALGRCTFISAVSKVLAKQACEIFALSQPPTVVPNSIDSNLWNPSHWSDLRSKIVPEGEIVLCHLSNMRPVKRPLDVVATLAGLRNRGIATKLMLIGDGPLLGDLYRFAEKLAVAEHILSFGEQEPERIPRLIAASDIMLITSESESFSLTALEAMACGVPVVGTRCGGLEEVMAKLDVDPLLIQGLLAPVGDVKGLVDSCLSLVRNEPAYRSIQRGSIRLPMEAYPQKTQIQGYLNILQETCELVYEEVFQQ